MFLSRLLLAGVASAGLAFSFRAPHRVPDRETSKAPCCFKNPAYAGTCKVEPTEDETCASILAYLNNPMAQGKSYCGGTEVRQGWTEASCEAKEAREKLP